MHDVHMAKVSEEFAACWQAAGLHLQQQAQGPIQSWLRAHLHAPFLEHLSFRLGNQLFFVRLEDHQGVLSVPGTREGLLLIAEGCAGLPCLMPMRKSFARWEPAHTGWGLVNARTGRTVSPPELITDARIVMTDWELHDFAVQVVRQHLETEGGRPLLSWQSNPAVDPALWFVGEHGPEWVVVRAARYPQKDAALPANISAIARSCARLSRIGHFASVGLINADDPFDPRAETNGNFLQLFRGHPAVVRFAGLVPVAP